MLFAFLPNLIHADNNDKYCSIMYAIYGICSPELVSNYLLQTSSQVYHAPRVIPQANRSLTIASTVSTKLISTDANVKTEPNVRYTWYWNNKEWVRGRLVG